MTSEQKNHPLHGVKLATILQELVDHYGWEILAEQINVNCFKNNPSIKSSQKFLMKSTWAREKLEAFYLYKFKHFPLPTDEQHSFSPRNRVVFLTPLSESPAEIALGDGEFFDDPASGPVMPSKKEVEATRNSAAKPKIKSSDSRRAKTTTNKKENSTSSEDPWSKWRE